MAEFEEFLLTFPFFVEVFGSGSMDGQIEAAQWRLDPGPKRWKARGPLIAGRTDAMIRSLTDAVAATRR